MNARKFAIGGDVGYPGAWTVFYWTGRTMVSRWTVKERLAKTWAKRETAEKWLPRVTPGGAMENLRVLEVAP